MSKGERPRDWDKEMADIDRVIAAGPPTPAPAQPAPLAQVARAPSAPAAAPRGAAGGAGRYAALFTWVRLALGLSLGAAMTQWPYTHGCGLPLFVYLGAVLAVLVAGAWSLVSSWKTRSALAHFLALALIIWGGVLAAREVLPRIGYAKQAAEWICAAPAVTVPTP